MPTDFSESNGIQDIDDGHPDKHFKNLKTPAVIKLDGCDIKPVSFKYSP